MDYDITWFWGPDETCVGLLISILRFTLGNKKGYYRYILYKVKEGAPSHGSCCAVVFANGTPPDEEECVMQTVLMLAKARYGL